MASRRKQKLQLITDGEPLDKRRKHDDPVRTKNALEPLQVSAASIQEVRIKVEPVDDEIDMTLFTHEVNIKDEDMISQEKEDTLPHEIWIKEEARFSEASVEVGDTITHETEGEISPQHCLGSMITHEIFIKEEDQFSQDIVEVGDEISTKEGGVFSQETTEEDDNFTHGITIKQEVGNEGDTITDEEEIHVVTQETIIGVEQYEETTNAEPENIFSHGNIGHDEISINQGDLIPQENIIIIETKKEDTNAGPEDEVSIKQDDSIPQENIIILETNKETTIDTELSQENVIVIQTNDTEHEVTNHFEFISVDNFSPDHQQSPNAVNHKCKLCFDPENTDKIPCYRCSKIIELADFTTHLKLIHKVRVPAEKLELYLKHFLNKYVLGYKCALCNRNFAYFSGLEKHVTQQHGLCNVCGVGVKHVTTMDHRIKHQKQFKSIYQCLVCYNEYPFEQLLLRHLRISHPSSKPFTFQMMKPKKNYNCPYCHFSSFCFKVVSFHMQFHSKRYCRCCGKKYIPTLSNIIQDWRLLCQKCNPLDNTSQLEFISDEETEEKLDECVSDKNEMTQAAETDMIQDPMSTNHSTSKNVLFFKRTVPTIIRKLNSHKSDTQNNSSSTTLRQYKAKTVHKTPRTSHENVCVSDLQNNPSTSASSNPFCKLNTENIPSSTISNENVGVSDLQNNPSTSTTSIPFSQFSSKNVPCQISEPSTTATCLTYADKTPETMTPYDPSNCIICKSAHTNLVLKCYIKVLIQHQTQLEQLLISCVSEESKADTLLEYKKLSALMNFLFKQDEYKKLDFVWLQRYKSVIDFLVTFDIDTDLKLQCYLCNLTGIPIIKFLDHSLQTHNLIYNIAARYIVKLYKFQKLVEMKYTCLLCPSYSNSDLKNIVNHVKTVHNLCRICGDFSIDLNHLKRHDSEFNSIYHCVVCHTEFTFETSYLDHVKCVHPEQTDLILLARIKNGYDCPYCHFSSKSINILNFHLTFHKKVLCILCKNFFVNNAKHVSQDKSFGQLVCCSCDKLQAVDRKIANTGFKIQEKVIEAKSSNNTQEIESKTHEKFTCNESTSQKKIERTELKNQENTIEANSQKSTQENESENREEIIESKIPKNTQDFESKNQEEIIESCIKKETQNTESKNQEDIIESKIPKKTQNIDSKNQENPIESNSQKSTEENESKNQEKTMESNSQEEIEFKNEESCEKKIKSEISNESNIQKPKIFILKRIIDNTEIQVEEMDHEVDTQAPEIIITRKYCVRCTTMDCKAKCCIAGLVKEIDRLKNDLEAATCSEKQSIKRHLLKLTSLHEFLINRGKSQSLNQNLFHTFRSLVDTIINTENDVLKTTQCYLCSLSKIPLLEYYDHLRVVHCIDTPLTTFQTFLIDIVPSNNDVKYPCLLCNCEPSKTLACLKIHLRITHNLCRICGEKQESIDQHWKQHNRDFLYVHHCLACRKEFPSKERSISHCNAHHSGRGKTILNLARYIKSLECPYCHYNTFSEQAISFHLKQHHLLNCDTCGMIYVSSANDIIDVNRKVCNSCDSKNDIAIIAASKIDAMTKIVLPCLYCDEIIENRYQLFSHIVKTHKACLICNEQFESFVAWTYHNSVTHLLNYKCEVCASIIPSVSQVELHVKTVHSSKSKVEFIEFENKDNVPVSLKSMQCPYCLLQCNSDDELNDHIMIGHNVKNCRKCSINLVVNGQTLCRKCEASSVKAH